MNKFFCLIQISKIIPQNKLKKKIVYSHNSSHGIYTE